MNRPTALNEIIAEMQRYKLQLLGLCETRKVGSGCDKIPSGETLIYSGNAMGGSNGVGLLLSGSANKSLVSWQPVSDRIMIARFKTPARHLTFLQVYAPTEQASLDEKETFYRQLSDTCRNIRKGDIMVLSGDMNAKVGSDNRGWETIMGRHGLGNMNENGELFAEFCTTNDLVIGGTLFQHKKIHKITWNSPDGKTKNQIDHITISRRWRSSLIDVRNQRGADVYSDHYLVVGQIRIKLAVKPRNTGISRTSRKVAVSRLGNAEVAERFSRELRAVMPKVSDMSTTEDMWNSIENAYHTTSENVLGYHHLNRKEWISNETWSLIEQRREVKSKMQVRNTRDLVRKYNNLHKQVSRNARSDKRKWIEDIAIASQEAERAGNTREMYRLTRKLSQNTKSHSNYPLKDRDGHLLTMQDEQTDRWSEYFEELLQQQAPQQDQSPPTPHANVRFDEAVPSRAEVREAIEQLKNNKSPGADNIAAELLKTDLELAIDTLLPLLQEVWNSENIPSKWKEGLIIKIPKKGDLSSCANWRGITLLNTINKILSIIVRNRIACVLEPEISSEHAGFRPGRSCIDHISTLRIIIEQTATLQSSLYLLFVDFERAFDTLNHHRMFTILESYSIPVKILNIIRALYRNASCRVVHQGSLGRPISVEAGVKQGCILSPFLFLLMINWVLKKANKRPRGMQWILNDRLEYLAFADDVVLMAHTIRDLKAKLADLEKYAAQVGLKINISKTKVMRIGDKTTVPTLELMGRNGAMQRIEEVDSFCYLGSVITKDGGADADIKSRIQKARQAFGMLNKFWSSPNVNRRLKLKIFKSNVLSVLLYGCETWRVTASGTSKLQVFVNRCLRRIMGIVWTDRIRNEELWKRTDMVPLENNILRRKWSWIGHTLRREDREVVKRALEWNPQGSRRRGGQVKTWRACVEDEAGKQSMSWKRVKVLVKDRVKWRKFCDALCSTRSWN